MRNNRENPNGLHATPNTVALTREERQRISMRRQVRAMVRHARRCAKRMAWLALEAGIANSPLTVRLPLTRKRPCADVGDWLADSAFLACQARTMGVAPELESLAIRLTRRYAQNIAGISARRVE